ncbi:hypothetical protein BofuT4_P051220.1 [Botrytis cinerea T4]|uniref:Uncharacterized protein n=1 Tax=Botryotinia fuckeliana (strain T4) TaxID=999810 RepID=G2XWU5_BOTF4|nr:hypothetical protein BofuT4_P051220.1 [Botrytis cinerea T4]
MPASISCIWPEYGNYERNYPNADVCTCACACQNHIQASSKQVKQSNFPSHYLTAEVGFSGIASAWSVLNHC